MMKPCYESYETKLERENASTRAELRAAQERAERARKRWLSIGVALGVLITNTVWIIVSILGDAAGWTR